MIEFSKRVEPITYPIIDMLELAREYSKKGKKIISLSFGDAVRASGFKPPKHVREALIEASKDEKNLYWAFYGDPQASPEFREAVAFYEKRYHSNQVDPDNVFSFLGTSEGFMYLNAVLINPGDEALIPSAWYPAYPNYVYLFDGKPVAYEMIEEEGWRVDVDYMRKKITPRTRYIMVCTPSNPTGSILRERNLKEILDLAAEHELVVTFDELYDQWVFEGQHCCIGSIGKDVNIVGFGGLSKNWCLPGYRMGWCWIKGDERFVSRIKKELKKLTSTRLSASTLMERVAIAALRGPLDEVREYVKEVSRRAEYCYKRINEIDGLSSTKPEGGFHFLPKIERLGRFKDDQEFALGLLKEKGVLVVPGSFFGPAGVSHFRETFLPPMEVLEEAHNLMEEFMRSLLSGGVY
ncbi:MAG: aminotransferase class I/II-fold pyridoxal phosphate-dependent enzyme [Candidatus Nezhaarchaeota archaeon]|nr:aminotransferase class I/II-fold pyridoxal phosphate-dependent enzyme [Candidatus Nezhaarchaeota archaeon]